MAPDNTANPADVGALVAGLSRGEITEALLHFESRVRLDFQPTYLASLPLDRLRHLLWTAILCLSPA